jgi:hypothetical protein
MFRRVFAVRWIRAGDVPRSFAYRLFEKRGAIREKAGFTAIRAV